MNKKQRPQELNLSSDHALLNRRQPSELKHQQKRTQSQYKSQLRRIQTSPGPGSYHIGSINDLYRKNKGVTMTGHHMADNKVQKKPDPWTYIPNSNPVQPRSPNATIGREHKSLKLKQMPGPADYNNNFKILFQRSRVAMMGSSRNQQIIQKKPGPADYDTLNSDKRMKRNISALIGRAVRPEIARQDSPGPSQYRIEDEFSLKAKNRAGFTMGSNLRSKTVCEAPDNYFKYNADKLATLYKAPAYTIKKQNLNTFNRTISPGPAEYSPRQKKREGITIPRSQRHFHKTESSSIATYDIASRQPGPAFSIPKAVRKAYRKSFKPGPADYRPEVSISEKYKYIGIGLGDKFKFQSNSRNPGPGNYNIVMKSARSGYTIGHQERRQEHRKNLPGPADYFINYKTMCNYLSQKKK